MAVFPVTVPYVLASGVCVAAFWAYLRNTSTAAKRTPDWSICVGWLCLGVVMLLVGYWFLAAGELPIRGKRGQVYDYDTSGFWFALTVTYAAGVMTSAFGLFLWNRSAPPSRTKK